jgi:hypothetical protein
MFVDLIKLSHTNPDCNDKISTSIINNGNINQNTNIKEPNKSKENSDEPVDNFAHFYQQINRKNTDDSKYSTNKDDELKKIKTDATILSLQNIKEPHLDSSSKIQSKSFITTNKSNVFNSSKINLELNTQNNTTLSTSEIQQTNNYRKKSIETELQQLHTSNESFKFTSSMINSSNLNNSNSNNNNNNNNNSKNNLHNQQAPLIYNLNSYPQQLAFYLSYFSNNSSSTIPPSSTIAPLSISTTTNESLLSGLNMLSKEGMPQYKCNH